MNRRNFIGTVLALAAAPAIVRASSLMPVRSIATPVLIGQIDQFGLYMTPAAYDGWIQRMAEKVWEAQVFGRAVVGEYPMDWGGKLIVKRRA